MENFKSGIKPTPVGKLLKEGTSTFSVSFFQRDYSWGRVQRRKFFDDLTSLEKGKQHFFGDMLFSETDAPNELKIIDGQQRLITVTIMAAVIRDILHERGDSKSEEIHSWYVKVKGRDEEYGFRLKLSDVCSVFFREHVQRVATPLERIARMKKDGNQRRSLGLMRDCYVDFYDRLKNKKTEELKDTWDKLHKGFFVVPMYVHNLGFASTYFETLNDRGMPLTLSDKMKCRLLHVADSEWTDAKQLWDNMSSLEGLDGNRMNTFLRHYWLSTEGQITLENLFDAYRMKINQDKVAAFSLLRELYSEAENYSILLKPVLRSFDGDKETLALLEELHILSKMQVMPLLMVAYPKFERSEFRKLLRYTINFIFRYLTIGQKENKVLEALFSRVAKDIRKSDRKDDKKAEFVLKEFRKNSPIDDEFQSIFAKAQIRRNQTAVYILKKIEMEMQKEKGRSDVEFNPRMTLEHILPKKPDKECEQYMKDNGIWDVRGELVNRLGNMTLLLRPANLEGRNSSPLVKSRSIYVNHTSLKINEKLVDLNSWILRDIDERQDGFTKLALKIWNLPKEAS